MVESKISPRSAFACCIARTTSLTGTVKNSLFLASLYPLISNSVWTYSSAEEASVKYSSYATSCFFCNQLCLRQSYSFDDENIDMREWRKTMGSLKRIVGSIGEKLICDECLNDMKVLLDSLIDLSGGVCRCSS